MSKWCSGSRYGQSHWEMTKANKLFSSSESQLMQQPQRSRSQQTTEEKD